MWIFKPSILISVLAVVLLTASSEIPLKKDEIWKCVRWRWAGTPGQSQVLCVEWNKRDCSNRLYPEICKLGG